MGKRSLAIYSLVALIGLTLAAPARAQAQVFTTNETFPIEQSLFIPCADEVIHITGTIHLLSVTTVNDNGAVHTTFWITQRATGVGLTTGDRYESMAQTSFYQFRDSDDLPLNATIIETFRFVGQGPGNNFTTQRTTHLTINENGERTADFSNLRPGECTNA